MISRLKRFIWNGTPLVNHIFLDGLPSTINIGHGNMAGTPLFQHRTSNTAGENSTVDFRW
ncbi:unnamed protein product [Larinioides sclopetarius]|uniref:Uncharacterized protein n=1 Tax=Larinioides sclopetarius TaxID=280406 RepID=A0AAV2BZF6_9ARAC